MTSFPPEDYLHSFINYELKTYSKSQNPFKLDRIKYLLECAGQPQQGMKCLHIVGTKGKGSTSLFAANILECAGYKVGVYTSPHLSSLKERIRVLPSDQEDVFRGQISDADLIELTEEIKPSVEKVHREGTFGRISFFEVLTALALLFFKQKEVDLAILEAGLGGRLDATNVVDGIVCAITPISLEHTQVLGSTIEQIAREKAAVIKNKKQIAVVARQEQAAREVIVKRCRDFGADFVEVGKDIRVEFVDQNIDHQTFHLEGNKRYEGVATGLLGQHQLENAAVALGIIEALVKRGFSVSPEAVNRGIEQTKWPARFEIIGTRPYVILDSAHNVASMRALGETLKSLFPSQKIISLIGVSEDKDKNGICAELNKVADTIIFTNTQHPRIADLTKEDFSGIFKGKQLFVAESVSQSLKSAFDKAGEEDVILVTGSLFLVAEAREQLKEKNYD